MNRFWWSVKYRPTSCCIISQIRVCVMTNYSKLLMCFSFVPASQDTEMRTRGFSKAFMMALRIHDRAPFAGPPETPRDHVIAASKAMRMGDWRKCLNFIINTKMGDKVSYIPNPSLMDYGI